MSSCRGCAFVYLRRECVLGDVDGGGGCGPGITGSSDCGRRAVGARVRFEKLEGLDMSTAPGVAGMIGEAGRVVDGGRPAEPLLLALSARNVPHVKQSKCRRLVFRSGTTRLACCLSNR
jgi:hypothetical protein